MPGISRLSKRYGNERVEVAATRALWTGAVSYHSMENILLAGLDRVPIFDDSASSAAPVLHHEHISSLPALPCRVRHVPPLGLPRSVSSLACVRCLGLGGPLLPAH